jgi:hypothetical protein
VPSTGARPNLTDAVSELAGVQSRHDPVGVPVKNIARLWTMSCTMIASASGNAMVNASSVSAVFSRGGPGSVRKMVGREGLEPPTSRLSSVRS